jgi:hypothetical protein
MRDILIFNEIRVQGKIYFGRHFAWLKYFTYHLVPVLAPNYKQNILSLDKIRKLCYSLANFMSDVFIWIYSGGGGAKFMKHFRRGTGYNFFLKFWATAWRTPEGTCTGPNRHIGHNMSQDQDPLLTSHYTDRQGYYHRWWTVVSSRYEGRALNGTSHHFEESNPELGVFSVSWKGCFSICLNNQSK